MTSVRMQPASEVNTW